MTSPTSRRILIASAAIACMFGALVFTSAPALAVEEYQANGVFGSAGSGNGQFDEPSGVAVNVASEPVLQPAMGDVYVIDAGNERVEQFSSTGAYISQWDGGATPAKGFSLSALGDAQGIAVDSSENPVDSSAGDVYVMDVGHKVINRFGANGKYEGQLAGTCASPGTCPGKEIPFSAHLLGIAVDPSGNLWVYQGTEESTIDEFSDTGAFVKSFETNRQTAGGTSTGLAVDSKDDTYLVAGDGQAAMFEGGKQAAEFGEPEAGRALALNDGTFEVLVDEGSSIQRFVKIAEANPNPSEIQTFTPSPVEIIPAEPLVEGLSESRGIAINGESATDTVYVSQLNADNVKIFNWLELPSISSTRYFDVSETGATLEGIVHPEGHAITSCRFEYGTTNAYGQSTPCEQSLEAINKTGEPVAVTAKLTGLAPASKRYVRLVAGNANGVGYGHAVLARPTIENVSVSRTGAIEATVNAEIDPNGDQANYRVEYGTGSVEELTTAPVSVGDGSEPVGIAVSLSGLRVGSVYHFRLVAVGPLGATFGAEGSFSTFKAVSSAPAESKCPNLTYTGFEAALPDCRAYELVSVAADDTYVPAELGAGVSGAEAAGEIPGWKGDVRAAEAGNAVAYVAGPTASGVGGNGYTGNGSGNNYLAVRGAKGWEASDIALAVTTEAVTKFTAFSNDLSVQTVSAPRFPELKANPEPAPECSQGIEFSRTVSGLHALTPANFGERNCFAPTVAISDDDNHILLKPFAALTPGASKGEVGSGHNLFDSADGVLHQVNVLPDGQPETKPDSTLGWYYDSEEDTYQNAVSGGGSRIFWTSLTREEEGTAKALYVRENDTQPQSPVEGERCTTPADACTMQVDAAEPGAPGPSGGAEFEGASHDGSKVFFTDVHRLTKNATTGPEEPDLYEYEVNAETGAPGKLTDLTADGHERADVQGVVGVSEAGTDVAFVADGALAGTNAEGRSPVAGQPNLYLQQGVGTTFVTTLTAGDNKLGTGPQSPLGDWEVDPGIRTAEVAPGGRFVGFMSTLSLAGYENMGVPEVYVYNAGAGRIFCASCDPTGAPPIPLSEGTPYEGSFAGTSQSASFMLRWINEREGAQVYFMSNQPLVSDDTNTHQDVYEWESDGSGNCHETAGCTGLLSNVGPVGNAYFMDASADGSDVFISSRSALTPTAFDETVKLYDVRVDGGVVENHLSCTGTGCQGSPPGLPIFATPASVTFNGVGNYEPVSPAGQRKAKPKKLVQCKKGFVRKHSKCVRSKPKKKSKQVEHSARKSSTAGKGR